MKLYVGSICIGKPLKELAGFFSGFSQIMDHATVLGPNNVLIKVVIMITFGFIDRNGVFGIR